MSLVRLLARPMLASIFVYSGVRVLRKPDAVVPRAQPVTDKIAPLLQRYVKALPEDTKALVRANAGVHIVAGTFLGIGWFPRLSSLTLAATLVPTTAAAYPFWSADSSEERTEQINGFLKNLSLAGGLLLAGVDTAGKPGVSWRTQRALKDVQRTQRTAKREAKLASRVAKAEVTKRASHLVH